MDETNSTGTKLDIFKLSLNQAKTTGRSPINRISHFFFFLQEWNFLQDRYIVDRVLSSYQSCLSFAFRTERVLPILRMLLSVTVFKYCFSLIAVPLARTKLGE